MSQQRASEYLSHGLTPFFRLPSAGLVDITHKVDAVILGVPYDAGTTYQPGARLAPYHVRRTSALVQTFHPHHKIDVFGTLKTVDGGNIAFPPFDSAAMRDIVHKRAFDVHDGGAVPFVVGGDHSISLPLLRAANQKYGPISVIHVDAHLDTSGAEVWGEPFHHGTPIRHAISEGIIERNQLFQVGIRATWGHAEEDAPSNSHGASIYSSESIFERGIVTVAEEIKMKIGDRPTYISFDVDGIDPAFAPGTGTPVSGGISARESLTFLRRLIGINLVGMDLVEVSPGLDHADMTCHLASAILFEGLALAAANQAQ